MNRVILILFLVSSTFGFSQLYISPNSYVYVNDQVLYVKQDVNMQSNGNMYLRNESQLLQGSAGASANSGLGKLSVFQEGTSDNYDYNYWCSPVGNPSGVSGNENFGITMLNMPTSPTSSTAALMLGISALDGVAAPLSIAPRWIYKYINSNAYSQWVSAGSASIMAPGEGFTMKGTSGTDVTTVNGVQNNPGGAQRYDFRGKPNDGNIYVNVGLNNQTLTGNPYPSALHVNAFLLDPANNACDGIAYYWEQNKVTNSHFLAQYQGGYGTFAPISLVSNGIYVPATFDTYDGSGNLNAAGTSSGLIIERKYAPIGQGFMIKGASTGTVTLMNSHRQYYKESGALSQFERHSDKEITHSVNDDIPHLRINAILNNQFTRQIALAFVDGATDGADRGIDAKSPGDNDLPNDVYFIIDNERYVIDGVNFDAGKRIPIGVKASNNSTFRFYIPEAVNFDENQPVYIFDALDNSYHEIRNSSYDVNLNEGVYDNRFLLTFINSVLGVPEHAAENLVISQDNTTHQLSISNPDLLDLTSCRVYDMAGKLIIDQPKLGTLENYDVATDGLCDGVYIVKVSTADGHDIGRKISVLRQNK